MKSAAVQSVRYGVKARLWCEHVANAHLHGTAGRIPAEMLTEEKLTSVLAKERREPLTVTYVRVGTVKAVEAMWPEAERIRCWVHKMRNMLDKVPEEARAILTPYLEAVCQWPLTRIES